MAKAPFDLKEYKDALDIGDVYGEKGYTTSERYSIRPTLDVNGIWGGYTGEGAKTVIASKGLRQDFHAIGTPSRPDEITDCFQNILNPLLQKVLR